MKRVISTLLLITLLLASVIAVIPASAATPEEFNLMGNSDKNKQWKGDGNVFYFDYYKYLDLGNKFEMTDYGNIDYMIRFPNAGSGSASVSDGEKTKGGVEHNPDATPTREINGESYNQYFGYSFKESVVADAVTLYIPADTVITQLDVYGATIDKDAKIFAKDAQKTLLASFKDVNTTATTPVEEGGATANLIVLNSELNEAFKLDYIYFAIKVNTKANYYIYEIELNGVLAKDAADFSALKAEYARYAELTESDWTEATWANLESALATTDPVNKNATSTEAEIASAAATLKAAIDALVAKPADKTALAAAIAEAAELVEEDYTPSTWEAFANALSEANIANGTLEISQSEVNAALANLKSAIKALKLLADKTDLAKAIADLENLKEADYTPKSWEALQTPIAKAIAVNNDESATQEEVDAALGALNMAINDLAKPGNKTALTAAITSAKALKQADYNVTAYSWNIFKSVLADAEEIANDPNSTQADMDMALETLNEKIEGLGKPVSKDDDDKDVTVDDDEDADADEDEEDETAAPATQAPATQAPATQPAPVEKKGCGSAVATTAAVLGLVAALGTALVVKKRD